MGVRGLTGFIARNAELYLTPYELHDCNLVIDGDNLACNLYKDVTGTYSAFGGDYDDFYRAVVEFFHVLAECNICAYVLMDGGYEWRKLRTVAKRLRGKISVIKRINPNGSIPVFPLMMKEVFVDAVRDCGVPVMRCVFEADDELAALSRKLRCPVLSYDSDFYIHNVRYIPLITVTVKAHTKSVQVRENEESVEAVRKPQRRLRKNEAKHVEKLTKANRIMGSIQVDNVEKPKKGKTYKYLDCCMYRIENLIARGALSKEKLPLFAALLGNDYIARSSFRNFFRVGLGKAGRSRAGQNQQRRIRLILQWLKHETVQSALEKILTRLKKNQRASLMEQVNAAVSGYSNEICHSYNFFATYYENAFKDFMEPAAETDGESSPEAIEDADDEEELEDVEEEEEETAIEEDGEPDEALESEAELEDGEGEDEEVNEIAGEDAIAVDGTDDDEVEDKTKQFPAWFLQKLYPANLPRFFVDLVYLKKYINNPQIEHFPHNDCNEVALPILTYIHTLLNKVDGAETQPRVDEEGTELPIEFTYLTRATRVTNIRYYRYAIEETPKHKFTPDMPNPLLFRKVFEGTMHNIDAEHLFERVNELPKDLQLYFLAIVYWLQKSPHCDLLHLHSLLICLVLLHTIDAKVPAERDLKAWQKRYGKIIKKERLIRAKEALEGVKRGIKPELQELNAAERISFVPKSDCYLVMDNMLKHFHMQELFKKKYDSFATTVLHGFAEFQAVVFQLHALNALLDFPFESPRMGQLYCGVLLYNLYDLLRARTDVRFYVENFIFSDSQMMFDFYGLLLDWCDEFVPHWKREQQQTATQAVSKKFLKKQRQAARKKAEKEQEVIDPNADMLDKSSGEEGEDDDFFDLNNKFCTFLKVK